MTNWPNWPLLFWNYKLNQPVNTSFGRWIILVLVTLSETTLEGAGGWGGFSPLGIWRFSKENRKRNRQSITISPPRIKILTWSLQLWTSLRHPNEPHSLKVHHLIPTFLLQSWSRGSHIYQNHTTMRQKFKSLLIWNRKKSLPFNPVWHPQETKPSMDTLN